MGQYDELLSAIPVSQLAQQVGADEAEVSQAVQQVLPALVGGLSANAQQPEGAAALTNALGAHTETEFGDLSNVNIDDGSKIVGHIFGDQQEAIVSQLGGLGGGGGGGLIKKLLPILAPIVLSFLAKKMGGAGGGGLGGALTDALGGGQAQTSAGAAPAGGGVGDLLGDLLGGALGGQAGGQAGGMGGLEDLLGGLLGGGKR